MHRPLCFAVRAVAVRPHPKKRATGGEDAYVAMSHLLGVADGVGSWATRGVDAGLYSRTLMKSCWDAASDASVQGETLNAHQVLTRAFQDLPPTLVGSSTAVLASIEGTTLDVCNLGDSSCLLYQGDQLLFRSEEQQHEFNFPFQLGTGSKDTPADATVTRIPVAAGQIVLVASDGVLDNLFDKDIGHMLAGLHGVGFKQLPKLLGSIADEIVDKACRAALDRTGATPFAEKCLERGMSIDGGKVDDTTLVLGYLSDYQSYEAGERVNDADIQQPPPYLSL